MALCGGYTVCTGTFPQLLRVFESVHNKMLAQKEMLEKLESVSPLPADEI